MKHVSDETLTTGRMIQNLQTHTWFVIVGFGCKLIHFKFSIVGFGRARTHSWFTTVEMGNTILHSRLFFMWDLEVPFRSFGLIYDLVLDQIKSALHKKDIRKNTKHMELCKNNHSRRQNDTRQI
jgi:hypothetical protein